MTYDENESTYKMLSASINFEQKGLNFRLFKDNDNRLWGGTR